jgi:hypothetical protein
MKLIPAGFASNDTSFIILGQRYEFHINRNDRFLNSSCSGLILHEEEERSEPEGGI